MLDFTFVKMKGRKMSVHIIGAQDLNSGLFYQLGCAVFFKNKQFTQGENDENTKTSMEWFVEKIPILKEVKSVMTDRGGVYVNKILKYFKKDDQDDVESRIDHLYCAFHYFKNVSKD